MPASNLDASGMRIVRKGCIVALGDDRGEVVRSGRGSCLVKWGTNRYPNLEKCRAVTVVSTGHKKVALTPQQIAECADLRERIATLKAHKFHASAVALQKRLASITFGRPLPDER